MPKKTSSKRTAKHKKAAPLPPLADIDDPKLGTLRFIHHINPQLDEYEGKFVVDGRDVDLRLCTDDKLDLALTIKRARELVRRHNAIMKRASRYIAANILPAYNQHWRPEDTTELNITEFVTQIQLAEITVHADGRATYWYNTGELLGGHVLQMFMNEQTEFTDYDTPG